MDNIQKEYYQRMLEKNRLMPITDGNRIIGLITFYIGNGDVNRYVRDDSWSVIEDEPETGDTCYIDQAIVEKERSVKKIAFRIFHHFKKYIRSRYPKVSKIRWNRFKGGKVNVYHRRITKAQE